MYFPLLKMEIKRTFCRWQSVVAFLFLIGFFVLGYELQRATPYMHITSDTYNAFILFVWAHFRFFVGLVLPLLVVLVAGDSLAWDVRTGFIQPILMKMSTKKYIINKVISVSIITFLAVFGCELITFLYDLIQFPFIFPKYADLGRIPEYGQQLFITHPILYVLLIMFNTSLAGMAFANVALVISTRLKNIYVVLATPWLLFILIEFISQIFSAPFSPLEWLSGYFKVVRLENLHSIPSIPIFWFIVWAITFIIAYFSFIRNFTRRIHHAK